MRNIREEWEELKKLARDMTSWWDNVPGVVKAGIEGIAPGLGGAIESTAAFGRESDDGTLTSPAIVKDADTDAGGGGLLGGIGGMFTNLLSTLGLGSADTTPVISITTPAPIGPTIPDGFPMPIAPPDEKPEDGFNIGNLMSRLGLFGDGAAPVASPSYPAIDDNVDPAAALGTSALPTPTGEAVGGGGLDILGALGLGGRAGLISATCYQT